MTQENGSLPESSHLHVESAPARVRAAPGERAVYAVTIENRSSDAQTQSLELLDLPQEWWSIEFDEMAVAFPGERRTATVTISIPLDAQPSLYSFRVIVKARGEASGVRCSLDVLAPTGAVPPPPAGPAIEAKARAKTEPPRAPGVSISPAHVTCKGGAAGEERLAVTVRNVGSRETQYSVSLVGLRTGWCTVPPALRVPGGEAREAQLRMHPPARAKLGDYPFKVRVAVDGHPNIAAEAEGTLTISRAEAKPTLQPGLPPTPGAGRPEEVSVPRTPVLPPEVSLTPRTSFRFGPGEVSAQAVINVQNKSKLIERYEIQVVGIPEEWFGLATTELRLEPGGNAQVPLRLTPRPGPGYPAGEYSFWVRVAPHRFPESFAEVGGLISIIGVPSFDARLAPAQSQGRKEKFKLTLVNTGSVPLSLWMEGSDPGGMCRFKFPPPPSLDPGEEAVVPVWVGARRNGLLGPPQALDFRLRVMPAGGESTAAKSFDARFIHQPFLSFRLTSLSLLLALLATILGTIFAIGPPRIGDGLTWLSCLGDDDYQIERKGFVFLKQACGGAPEDAQQALRQGTPVASPTQAQTAQPTPQPTAAPTGCTPSGDVGVGDHVTIVPSTRIRADAGLDKRVLRTLTDARPGTVLEGYKCADNLTWWRVRVDDLEGWAAERHTDGTQLLVP